MDISKQFSFTDFLAYLFPGIMSIFGVCYLLMLSPASDFLSQISLDITTGIMFLVISYVIGVISSGFSGNIVKLIEKLQKYRDVRKTIPFDDFQDDVLSAFQDVFDHTAESKTAWSRTHYYLCRALVSEKMPSIGIRADRQSNFALFRRNLVLPIFVWLITGIAWGISFINSNLIEWGFALIVVTILVAFFSIKVTVERLHDGESRETREILVGFLAGHKAKLFANQSKR